MPLFFIFKNDKIFNLQKCLLFTKKQRKHLHFYEFSDNI